jgi:hypothetical protein
MCGRCGMDSPGPKWGSVTGYSELGIEHLHSLNCVEFLDYLRMNELIKKCFMQLTRDSQ